MDLGSLTLQAVIPTPTPFPQMDPKASQVTLELVPGCVGGWSSGHASCLRTSEASRVGAGLATFQVIRSGMFLPLLPQQKSQSSQMIPTSDNATLATISALSCFVLVSYVESFRASKAGNLSAVKGHGTGVYILGYGLELQCQFSHARASSAR